MVAVAVVVTVGQNRCCCVLPSLSSSLLPLIRPSSLSPQPPSSALPSVMAPVMSTLGLMIHESSPRPRCREGADDVARGAQSGDRARHVGEEVVA